MPYPLLSNGLTRRWLPCCWCPDQPPAIDDTGDEERTILLALASAKRAGWRIAHIAGRWQGLCPACVRRGCEFRGR